MDEAEKGPGSDRRDFLKKMAALGGGAFAATTVMSFAMDSPASARGRDRGHGGGSNVTYGGGGNVVVDCNPHGGGSNVTYGGNGGHGGGSNVTVVRPVRKKRKGKDWDWD